VYAIAVVGGSAQQQQRVERVREDPDATLGVREHRIEEKRRLSAESPYVSATAALNVTFGGPGSRRGDDARRHAVTTGSFAAMCLKEI